MGRISVRRLRLTDFRCYETLALDLDDRPVVLTGPNGAGKTNLLEAISFLVPGRGLRRARLVDVARRVAPEIPGNPTSIPGPWAVAATVNDGCAAFDIGTGLSPEAGVPGGPGRRTVRIDGAPARGQVALGERLAALWLTPDMQRLFTEGASGRRRFLDRLVFVFDPAHAGRLMGYEKAMRERARMLADAATAGRRPDSRWAEALEAAMVEKGVAIVAARGALIQRLNPACAMGAGPFPAAEMAVEGTLDDWLAAGPALEAEDRFRAALAVSRHESSFVGIGPHRSDLTVTHIARGMPASHCSTGEQKALLISIVLANVRLQSLDSGVVPLLLLDEVAAHLDEARRIALFDEISALGAQAWMTGTDRHLFAPLGDAAQNFSVSGAVVVPS
jgi:DNA replication and repair protein RecF